DDLGEVGEPGGQAVLVHEPDGVAPRDQRDAEERSAEQERQELDQARRQTCVRSAGGAEHDDRDRGEHEREDRSRAGREDDAGGGDSGDGPRERLTTRQARKRGPGQEERSNKPPPGKRKPAPGGRPPEGATA